MKSPDTPVATPITTGTISFGFRPAGAHLRRLAGSMLAAFVALAPINAASPGSPTAVSADPSDSSAVVSFTAPASDGGSSIRYYEVTTVESPGLKARGRRGPITVLGLTNGTPYTFVVTATNSDGTSANSVASSAVTPGRIQFGHGHWSLSGSQDFKGTSSGSLSSSSGSSGSGYTGTSAGWTLTSKINPGMQNPAGGAATALNPPTALSHLALTSGGAYLVALIGGTALSVTDPGTDNLQLPIFGTSSLLLNDTVTGSLADGIADNNGGHGQNAIIATKTYTVSAGEVDPLDGQVHVRLATAPVVVNPAHNFDEQPYQFVQIENLTLGTTLYTDLNVAGAVGVPWVTSSHTSNGNPIQYTTWQLVDWTGTNGQIGVGDQIRVTLVTASCSRGGHWGRAYAAPAPGALGNASSGIADFPTAYVTATGPAAVAKGSNITYTLRYRNISGSNIDNTKVDLVIPTGTTYVSTNAGSSSYNAGTSTLTVTLGSVLDGDYGSFDVVVNSGATVGQVTLGNYILTGTLAGTATPILPAYGSKVYTTIDDLYTVVLNSNNGAGGSVVSTPDVGSLNFGATTSTQSVVKGRTASITATPSSGYQFTGWTGYTTSASATISVTVNSNITLNATFAPLNTPPVVTTTAGTTSALEQVAVAVDSALTVADSDSPTLASGTVQITGNLQVGQDALGFTNDGLTMGNISAVYTSGTGTLALTSSGATATVAQWQAALRAVTYTNSSNAPNTSTRTVTYQVNDGALNSSNATRTVSVTAVNDAPVGTPKTVTTAEDTDFTFAASDFGFTDPNDSPANAFLSVKITALPAAGTLKLSGTPVTAGQFISFANIPNLKFSPAANANGSPYTTFTFQVKDDGGTANSGVDTDLTARLMTVNVSATNDAPIPGKLPGSGLTDPNFNATNNRYEVTTPEDTPFTGQVKAYDAEGDPLTFTKASDPAHGTVVVNANGTYTYTPALNYNGPDSFTVSVSDGNGGTAVITVYITVTPVNDPPVAPVVPPQKVTAPSPWNYTFPPFTDVDDTVTNYTVTGLPPGITFDPLTRTFSGKPTTPGTYTIYVRGTDPWGAYDTLAVILTVELPPAPVATADTASAKEAGGVNNQTAGTNPSGNLLSNDSGTTIRVTSAAGASVAAGGTTISGRYGTLLLKSDGSYTYTVNNNLAAVQALNVNDSLRESFRYTITDEFGRTAEADLTVTIDGTDDAPVAAPITPPAASVGKPFGPFTFAPFTDVDNSVLTYTVTGLPPGVTFDPLTRTFSGTPTQTGTFRITVTGSDGQLSDSVSFNLQVFAPPVNTLPNGTITVRGDPVRFVGTDGSVLKVDDADSPELTVRLTVGAGMLTLPQRTGLLLLEGAAINDQTVVVRGTLANLNAALAQLIYQAPTGYIGTDTLTIVSTDDQGNSDTDVTNPPISVVLSTLGGNDAAASIGSLGNGKAVAGAKVTQFDSTLVKSASVSGTGATAQLVIGTPTRQDGSVQQTTVTVEVTFTDGSKESFKIPVTIYNPKLEIITVLSLNPQTSLYEQRLQVTNTTPYVIDSYRVVIPTLPAGVTLYSKSTQTSDGRPAVADTAPLQPGQKRVMIIEYFAPNVRQFPEPAVTLEINSVNSLPSPVGTTAAVDRTIVAPNGRIYVEFTTTSDKAYWVQYRDSATAAWQTSPVAVAGTGTTISWLDDGPPKTVGLPTAARQYQLIVAAATAVSSPLAIAAQPEAVRAAAGTNSALSIRMQGTGPFTYQWYRDGSAVAGATAATLNLAGLGLQNEGDYYVVVSDGRSTLQSAVIPVALLSANPARIVNLAVRANLDAGADPLITGFVIEGTSVRPMLVRGVGPALRQFGLTTAAANTALKLYSGSTVLSENDDWELDVTPDVTRVTAATVGAFALPAKSADAALVRRLPAAPYTIHTFNRGTTAGPVLVETYDGQTGYDANSRITNVSTRARVTAGDGALIAGLTIEGATTCRVLARVVGPTLASFGVTGTLADPTLQLFAANGTTVVASNDDWATVQALVTSENLFRRVGAFDLPSGSRDSVIVTRLAPGSYTFVAQGKGAAEGQALIEIYLID